MSDDIDKLEMNLKNVEENYFLMLNLIKKFVDYSDAENSTMFRVKVEEDCQKLLEEIDATWPKISEA